MTAIEQMETKLEVLSQEWEEAQTAYSIMLNDPNATKFDIEICEEDCSVLDCKIANLQKASRLENA